MSLLPNPFTVLFFDFVTLYMWALLFLFIVRRQFICHSFSFSLFFEMLTSLAVNLVSWLGCIDKEEISKKYTHRHNVQVKRKKDIKKLNNHASKRRKKDFLSCFTFFFLSFFSAQQNCCFLNALTITLSFTLICKCSQAFPGFSFRYETSQPYAPRQQYKLTYGLKYYYFGFISTFFYDILFKWPVYLHTKTLGKVYVWQGFVIYEK